MPESAYDKVYYQRLIGRNAFQVFVRSFFFLSLRRYLKGDVLDLGCGIGEASNYVQSQQRYSGVDINPYCIDHLQKRGLWARLGSVYQIPLETAAVDVVVLSHVLEHLEAPDAAMDEISRVLRPSGTLIVIVPMRRGFAGDSTHRIFYQPKQLKEIAHKHHFDVKSISMFPMPWEFLGTFFYFFEYRMIARKV